MLGRLNAAHANENALAAVSKNPVAAQRSVIGLLASYKANVEAAVNQENEADVEEGDEETPDPVAAAAHALAAAANKSINNNAEVVEAVNGLLGITGVSEETAQDIADQATAAQQGDKNDGEEGDGAADN